MGTFSRVIKILLLLRQTQATSPLPLPICHKRENETLKTCPNTHPTTPFPLHAFIHAWFLTLSIPRKLSTLNVFYHPPLSFAKLGSEIVGCSIDLHIHFIGMALLSPPDPLKSPWASLLMPFSPRFAFHYFYFIYNQLYLHPNMCPPQRLVFCFLAFTFPLTRFPTVQWMVPTLEHT